MTRSADGAGGAHDAPDDGLALNTLRLARWVLRWRLAIILASILAALAAGVGILFLQFNPDTRSFFGPDNPDRVALDNLESKYANASNIILILVPKDGNVFTPRFLEVLADATAKSWRIPFTFRVDSLTNFQELKSEGDDLSVSPLYPAGKIMTPADAAQMRARALAQGELAGRLVSSGGDVTAISIVVNRPRVSGNEVRDIAAAGHALADEIRKAHPGIEVRVSGGVLADVAFAEAGVRDTALLVPLMAVVILLVLMIGLRSVTVTLVTSVVIGLTIIITMGVFGWMGTVLNSVTAAAPPVIMTLFFADCVHFVMAAVQQQTYGRTTSESIMQTIRLNFLPTVIKSLTTVIGFLSLNFSDSPPLNQLGNVVAVGSLIGAALTITLIPALLSYMKLPKYNENMRAHRALTRFARWTVGHNRRFLLGALIVFPVLLAMIPRIEVNDNFVRYFDKSFAFRVDTDFLEQRLTGLHGLVYSLPSGQPEGIVDPSYLRQLDRFAEWYRGRPHVAHVSTLADVIRRLHKAMNGDDPAFDTIPDDRKLIAQYLLLYELSLPAGQDLSSLVDIRRTESIVTVRLTDVSSQTIIDLAVAGQDWLQANAPAHFTRATGLSLVYSRLTQRNIEAMMLGTACSVLLVSLIMAGALRNWRLGWISLVVNLAPAGVAFGVWGLIGAEVNLAISVVTSITYGIVTDDTVHTMTKYRWARRALGMSPADAARETITYTGSAVILSSLALALGFALLGLSSFNITAVMGALSAMIIAIAALAELFLLPGLLIMFDREPSPRRRDAPLGDGAKS